MHFRGTGNNTGTLKISTLVDGIPDMESVNRDGGAPMPQKMLELAATEAMSRDVVWSLAQGPR